MKGAITPPKGFDEPEQAAREYEVRAPEHRDAAGRKDAVAKFEALLDGLAVGQRVEFYRTK